jgi:hypothetical protein
VAVHAGSFGLKSFRMTPYMGSSELSHYPDSLQLTCQPLFATMAVNSKGFPLWALSLLAIPRFCRRGGGVDVVTGIVGQVPSERASGVSLGEGLGTSSKHGRYPSRPGWRLPNLPRTSVIWRNACSLLGRVLTR